KSLEIMQKVLDENHPSLATNYINISMIYKDLGDLEKALEYSKKALNIPNIDTSIKSILYNHMYTVFKELNIDKKALKYKFKSLILMGEVFQIDKLIVSDFFSLKDITISNLKNKKEVYIVGENGDGKSLLLQSIIIALKGTSDGVITDFIKDSPKFNIQLNKKSNTKHTCSNLFTYSVYRNNSYLNNKEDELGYLNMFDSSFKLKNIKDWLKDLKLIESEKFENSNISFKFANKLLRKLLDRDINIEVKSAKVIFSEKGEEVSFEKLSSGYRNIIQIICDLLIRLSEKQPFVNDLKDYRGIVIIDELELHLHPKLIYTFVSKLRKLFPKIQFIMTTHSPTALLGASPDAVFYKIYKDNGKVFLSEQIKNEGYTSNTLITSPLFNLPTTKSGNYKGLISDDDYVYEKIHKVVHDKIKENININEEELLRFITEEFNKL
uniref:AAA family ATPase n=1 Tax=Poseidonibacter lekithochrous TaxID=1904463 RepID=UPI000DF468C6